MFIVKIVKIFKSILQHYMAAQGKSISIWIRPEKGVLTQFPWLQNCITSLTYTTRATGFLIRVLTFRIINGDDIFY